LLNVSPTNIHPRAKGTHHTTQIYVLLWDHKRHTMNCGTAEMYNQNIKLHNIQYTRIIGMQMFTLIRHVQIVLTPKFINYFNYS